jgi:tetratricopeptide (TPR) repeat protein
MADAEIDQRVAQEGAARQGEPPEIAQQRRLIVETVGNQWRAAKRYASYWLGLVAYERENYPTAIDYFEKRTLEATPDGPWTGGARYNLGRSYESLGKAKEAIAAYRSDESEQRYGSRLRAARLETAAEVEKKPE